MAARTTIVCLLFFVVACFSAPNISLSVEGDIKPDSTVNFTIPASNLHDRALFSINNTVSVVVCFQQEYSLPAGDQFSNETCTFFYNLTAGHNSVDVPLRNLLYFVGVWFADVKPENASHVTLTVVGDLCDAGKYYDEDTVTCRPAEKATIGENHLRITHDELITYFYEVEVPELAGHVQVTLQDTEEAQTAGLKLRYAAAPGIDYDASIDNRGIAKFVSPRPGVWVIGLEVQAKGEYNFTVDIETCAEHEGLAGDGCHTPYSPARDNITLIAFPNQYTYWSFIVTREQSLNVSVTTLKQKDLPHLLLSKGNLPTLGNADITNCNSAYCNLVHRVHVSATSDEAETWFIGVTASVEEGNTTYGIWFNTTCAPECETNNHGSCEVDGTCTCQLDFTGIDCHIQNGLGAQYIVLIIIASLVVASAVIGFVAWAYMRRKRVNYELVS